MNGTEHPEKDEPLPEPGPEQTPVVISFTSEAQDPELRTAEAILQLLQLQPYEARVRMLQYVRARITGDSGSDQPVGVPYAFKVNAEELARAMAESDGHVWDSLNARDRHPYFRSAAALTARGYTIVRDPR